MSIAALVRQPRLLGLGAPGRRSAIEAGGWRRGATGGVEGWASIETAVAEAVENAAAAFQRQQAERRVRAGLRVPHGGGERSGGRQRCSWAQLLRRAFGVEVLVCARCSGASPGEVGVDEAGGGVAERWCWCRDRVWSLRGSGVGTWRDTGPAGAWAERGHPLAEGAPGRQLGGIGFLGSGTAAGTSDPRIPAIGNELLRVSHEGRSEDRDWCGLAPS